MPAAAVDAKPTEFGSEEELRKALASDPTLLDQLEKDLKAYDDEQRQAAEKPAAPPKPIAAPAAEKKDKGGKPEGAPEQTPPKEPEDEEVTVKIRK